jgi:mono/diheme cytochrome c family protein
MSRTIQLCALCVVALCLCLAARAPHATVAQASSTAAQSGGASAPADAAALFGRHCATCHGKDGRAKTFKAKFNHARDLTDADWQAQASDERLFNSITAGRGKKMPAFAKKLSKEQIESLVAYVRSLKK